MTKVLKERTIRIATPVIVMWPFAVLPLMAGIGAVLTHVSVPAEAKLLVTMAGATLILTLTYDLFIRSTWLGEWLNGKKRNRMIFASRKKRQPDHSA